jgi:hypothetical protein
MGSRFRFVISRAIFMGEVFAHFQKNNISHYLAGPIALRLMLDAVL